MYMIRSLTSKTFQNLNLINSHGFARKNILNTKKFELKLQKNLRNSIVQATKQDNQKTQRLRKQASSQRSFHKWYMSFFSVFMGYVIYDALRPQNREAIERGMMQDPISKSLIKNQRSNDRGLLRVIPAQEAIPRILSGEFSQELVIERGYYRQEGGRFLTTCCMFDKFGIIWMTNIENLQHFLQTLENSQINHKIRFQYLHMPESTKQSVQTFSKIFNWFMIGTLIVSFFYLRAKFRKSQMYEQMMDPMRGLLGSKKFQPIKPQNITTKFKDVAGMHQAKSQITEFVDFLKLPDQYIEMGAKVPKGALLTGPPGTGKTLLAKACAGEAGVPFFYVSGSDFVQKYVGLGANRVRQLFDQAEKASPSIIFIDEIDAIGKKRDAGPFSNEEKDNTLNQLLVKMDGFDTHNKVIVMAATNRKDMLDPALLRPGRFDRTVQISLPNAQQRKQILKVHLIKVKFESGITIDDLANKISTLTPGFSGAQLANVCNEAAIQAARLNLEGIGMPQFQKAVERVVAGLQKRNMFTDEEKDVLAYYESGKAVIGWFVEGADPLIKISILPFSKSNKGYSHSIKDQHSLNTKDDLLAKTCAYLAGRASEIYFKNYMTTNGDQDLKKAKRIIEYIVRKFGMSEKLKMMAFPDIQFVRKPYSQKVESIIDEEIKKITTECISRVQAIVKERSHQIQKVKQLLIQKETLSHRDIQEVLGKRPFEATSNYQEFLQEQQAAKQPKVQSQTLDQYIKH